MGRASSRVRKVKAEVKPAVKEKFQAAEELGAEYIPASGVKFVPATNNQKIAVSLLRGGCRVLFLHGSSGTGKSMLAAWWAAELLKNKKIENIYLVRPAVITGKTSGHLPGTEHEKLEPFFAQTLIHLAKFLGDGFLKYCIERKKIQLKSGEFLRGRSFESCAVISEESQNFTASDMEMMLTRLGDNATLLFTGDEKQNDLKGASGLLSTINLIEKMVEDEPEYLDNEDLDCLEHFIGSVRFMPEDCVRSGLTRAFVKMYYNN